MSPPEIGLRPLGQLSLCLGRSPLLTAVEPQTLRAMRSEVPLTGSLIRDGGEKQRAMQGGSVDCHWEPRWAFPFPAPHCHPVLGTSGPPCCTPALTPVPKDLVSCSKPQAMLICPPACTPLSATPELTRLLLSAGWHCWPRTSGGLRSSHRMGIAGTFTPFKIC